MTIIVLENFDFIGGSCLLYLCNFCAYLLNLL